MRKRGRPRTLSLEGDLTRIGFNVCPKTKERVEFRADELNTSLSNYLRGLIERDLSYDHNLEVLEKSETETKLILENIQRKIIEEKNRIQENKTEENEKLEKIEEAHGKLLKGLIHANWHPERITLTVYKTYSDYTGLSPQILKKWVEEQVENRTKIEDKIWEEENKINPKKIKIEEPFKTKDEIVKEAHKDLINALRRADWNPELIQNATFKIYADYTGLSVQELIDWVNEQAKKGDELDDQ